MYAVVGTDGVVYGPVPVGTLFEWIAQGRLVPNSELIDGQGRRFPASMAPELRGAFPAQTMAYGPAPTPYYGATGKSRTVALALGFLLGPLGAHRFYLGHTWSGLAMLALTVLTLRMDLGAACVLAVVVGVWQIADLYRIGNGKLRMADGRGLS